MEEQNTWWTKEKDPHIRNWEASPVRWIPPILNDFHLQEPGLHFLTGPRQVGKTTMLKMMIRNELSKRDPFSVLYYSCDEILDHRELGEVIDNYLSFRKEKDIDHSLMVLDEVSFVSGWWRALKSRLDRGILSKDIIMVTGSAPMDILGHVDAFPGRRGTGEDHIMYPLSFSEYCRCIGGLETERSDLSKVGSNLIKNRVMEKKLKNLWNDYLVSGGFPQPIIDVHSGKGMTRFTSRSFLEGIRGDWAKAGKKDQYMKQVLRYIIRARGTPVSWNSMSTQTSINSPNTTRSYVELLESTFVAMVLNLIGADGRINYKKNRKIHILDPFILRVLSDYVREPVDDGWLLESTVASIIGRGNEVNYFRNGTEADIVMNDVSGQIGFEITKGIKSWKKPWHLKEAHLLDRDNVHLYMASLN